MTTQSGGKVLTVSIAAYNVEPYLAEALDSLIASNVLSLIEVIVVDDGSKDGTADLARFYSERHPESILLLSKKNGGYGSTINTSLEIARGRYFKILDGDDWYDPKGLSSLVRFLDTCMADLVVTKYMQVRGEREKEIALRNIEYDGETRPIEPFLTQGFPMHAAVFKTSVLKDAFIHITEHAYYTDQEFMVKSVSACRTVAALNATVYRYRIGREGQSIATRSWFKNIDGACETALELARFEGTSDRPRLSDTHEQWLQNEVKATLSSKYRVMLSMGPSDLNRSRIAAFDQRLSQINPQLHKKVLQQSPAARLGTSDSAITFKTSAFKAHLGALARMAIGH